MVHLGDQVGWPRGGLAPSATYSIAVNSGGFLSVVGGTFTAWLDEPGPGPLLTPTGELDQRVAAAEAPNVVPLRPRSGPAGTSALPRRVGPGGESGLTCPCHNPGGLRLADRHDEQRELDRSRRAQSAAHAITAAGALLVEAVRADGSPDVEALVEAIRAGLDGELAMGPFAQRVAAGVPAEVMSTVLRRLLTDRVDDGPAAEELDAEGDTPRHAPGSTPGQAPARSVDETCDAHFRVVFRMLAQRTLAVHGEAVLDALPARFIADGMAAEALVRPRLERLLGCPLPGELGRLARWSLHGMDGTFGDVDPTAVEITLLAMGVVLP
jgi:hypothetical protein